MNPAVVVVFNQFAQIEQMGENVEMALVRALNKTSAKARTAASRAVRDQVAFPASYVSPSNRRLFVSKKATRKSLESRIEGRGRATSLATFSRSKPTPGRAPKGGEISVQVKPGITRKIARAFLITLRNNNVGLAVRTSGPPPRGAYKPKLLGKNLWLLYGPSVDQALMAASDGDGVFEDMSEENLNFLEYEFNRQLDLLEGTSG